MIGRTLNTASMESWRICSPRVLHSSRALWGRVRRGHRVVRRRGGRAARDGAEAAVCACVCVPAQPNGEQHPQPLFFLPKLGQVVVQPAQTNSTPAVPKLARSLACMLKEDKLRRELTAAPLLLAVLAAVLSALRLLALQGSLSLDEEGEHGECKSRDN